MGKITFLARTFLLIIFLLGSSLSFLTAKNKQTAEMTISGTVHNVSCSGGNDGSISTSISGGVAPFTITWSNFSHISGNISGLAAGSYTINVTDKEGTSISQTFEVTEPAPLQLSSPTTTEVSCYGANDGTITAGTVTGGTSPYVFSINGNFTSSPSFSNLSEGTYTVIVKDAKGCEASQQVQVTQPQILAMGTPTFTAVSCNGGSDGSVTAGNVSGGTGSYQYSLNNGTFQNPNSFSNLSAGTYIITVRDQNQCETSQEITVSQPDVLTMATPAFTAVSCNGGSDGTVTAGTVSGGTGSYQYQLNNGTFGSANTFSNLSAGVYTIKVKDANACTTSQEVTVTQPDALTMAAPAFTAVTCNGGSDGTVTSGTVSGGTGPYQYKLNNGSFGSANAFSNLSAGVYTITIKDANACTTSQEVTLTQPDVLNATVTFSDLTCNTSNDGTISILTPTGGSGSYQYSINNGNSWQDSGLFTNLSDGTYPTLIRDKANPGCTLSLNTHLEITRPFKLMGDISGENVSCKGGSDGSIIVSNATGGNDLYEFSINGTTWQTSEIFENLAVGTYSVQIRDAVNKGCVEILDPAYSITEPPTLVAAIDSKTDVLCNGYATGAVTASATGGTAPYTFSWGSLGPGATKTDLPAGTYAVTVKDANGCTTAPVSVTITQPATFVEFKSVNTTSGCYQQNNGTARVEVQGGTGNYSFLWSNGQTTPTATGLAPGNHTVTVKDGNGCEKSRTVTISTPTQLKITGFLTTETTLYGTATGTATVQVAGGSPTYTFKWSGTGNRTGQTARDLAAGTYTVTVTDANGCTATGQVTIIDALDATIIPTSICEGEEEIVRTSYFQVDNLTARGGTAGYTYNWNFGENATPASAIGPGPHRVKYSVIGDKRITLKVTDSKGRTLEKQIVQYVGGCFSNDCGSNDLQAENYFVGDANGNKITNLNCSTAGQKYLYVVIPTNSERYSLNIEYIYSIKNLSTGEIINDREAGCFYRKLPVPTIARTIPINYTCGDEIKIEGIYLTFSNNNNWDCGQGPNPKCYSTNNEATVTIPLYAVAFPNDLLCNGGLNGVINARASGGSGIYTYKLISSTGSTIRTAQASSSFTGLPAGKYKVVVNDGVENYTTAEVEIRQPLNPLALKLVSDTDITCYMGSDGTATVLAEGGTPNSTGEPYIYVWSNGQTTATASNLTAGEYTVRVIDANGCEVTLPVQIAQPAQILAVAGPDQTLYCGTTSTQLEAVYTSEVPEGQTAQTGEWTIVNGPAGGTFGDKNDPNTTFSGAQGTYTLRWTVPCGASDDVKISVSFCSTLDFDGVNDHIVFGDNFNPAENFAFEAWVKPNPNTSSGIKTILSKRNISGLPEGGFDLVVENNIPKFRWNNSSIVSQFPIGTDRWYHIAVIKGGIEEGLYVDGIKVNASGTSPGSPSPVVYPFIVGAAHNATTPSTPGNYFHGWIEEVRIWNVALTLEQLHFMMNQRLQNNGGKVKGVEIPYNVPGELPWTALTGYYQMEKVENGYTLGEISGSPKGNLVNITTFQERTAPLPYISNRAGAWFTDETWLRPQVWDPPGSIGIDGTTVIDWNIAQISHNISSGAKDIKLLGLLSKTGKLTVAKSGESLNETNSGQSLTITHYLQLNGIIDLVGESQLVQTDILKLEDIDHDDTALPQTVISVLDETSSGFIERDQQGTANSYNYNYWSSPVSHQGTPNNSTYTISTVMLDGTNSSAPKSLSFGGEYWFADGSFTTPRKVSNYWINKFRGTANVYSEWKRIGSSGTLNAGEGYTMKGTSGTAAIEDRQNYVFKGKPNNGTILLTVGTEQNYLLGNPFPSAIDVNRFILDNLNKTDVNGATNTANIFNGAVYFWDHFAGGNTHILKEYIGGYATRNLIGGVAAISNDERVNANDNPGSKEPGRFIPVGQGFFVNTAYYPENAQDVNVTGGDIIFRNKQRAFVRETSGNTGNSLFLRPEEHSKEAKQAKETDTRPKIRLDFRSPMGYYRQILIGVDANASNGFDLGYDALMNDYNLEDIYWIIGDREYVIQGVSNFGLTQAFPLGVRINEDGEMMVKINKLENIDGDVEIYLKDKLNKIYYDLREAEVKINLSKGEIRDRFEIVFQKEQDPEEGPDPDEGETDPGSGETDPDINPEPGTGEPQNPESPLPPGTIDVLYAEDENQLRVLNPHEMTIQRVEIYNLVGQRVEEFKVNSTNKRQDFDVRKHPSALYVVKVFAKEGMASKNILLMR